MSSTSPPNQTSPNPRPSNSTPTNSSTREPQNQSHAPQNTQNSSISNGALNNITTSASGLFRSFIQPSAGEAAGATSRITQSGGKQYPQQQQQQYASSSSSSVSNLPPPHWHESSSSVTGGGSCPSANAVLNGFRSTEVPGPRIGEEEFSGFASQSTTTTTMTSDPSSSSSSTAAFLHDAPRAGDEDLYRFTGPTQSSLPFSRQIPHLHNYPQQPEQEDILSLLSSPLTTQEIWQPDPLPDPVQRFRPDPLLEAFVECDDIVEFLSRGDGVYTEEVWGDMLDVVRQARREVEEEKGKGKEDDGSSALARLRLIQGQLRSKL